MFRISASRSLLSIIACSVLLLAGCGSSGSGSSNKATPKTTTTTSAAPITLSTLQSIVLQTSDLPPGYKGSPYVADPTSKATDAKMTKCLGVKDNSADKTGEANSQDFALRDVVISSKATGFKSQADVDSDVAALTGTKSSGCFKALFKEQVAMSLPPGSKVKSIDITIKPGNAGGPNNVVATGTGKIAVTVQGQTLELFVGAAFVTGRQIEAEIDFMNVGSPVPADVQSALIAKVASRTAAS